MKLTHSSLFSGIGGFDLAARNVGIENIFQVEIDEFCQKLLTKNFPETKKYRDIRKFDARKYKGRINIISGGFPCQPFSVAGRRQGKNDERALFPQMLRVIQEVRPDWVIAENVQGIFSIDNGQYFEDISTSLEDAGYEVKSYILPATAVNAPHRRNRVWIIANSRYRDIQREKDKKEFSREVKKENAIKLERPIECNQSRTDMDTNFKFYDAERLFQENWLEIATKFCGVGNGLPKGVDGIKHRIKRLKVLGNAIVPQIAEVLFLAIIKTENELRINQNNY